MIEHHRARPDLADRIGDALAGDVGRRAVHGLEQSTEISRSGLMFADGAMPMVPQTAGPRSERMSPNRFEPTTTSNQSGCATNCARQDVDVVLVGADARDSCAAIAESARPSTAW